MDRHDLKCNECGAEVYCICNFGIGPDTVDIYELICCNCGIVDSYSENDYLGQWTKCPFCGESSKTHKRR